MTVSIATTLQSALNAARPGQVDDILRLMRFGDMMTPLIRRFTSLTASATMDLTALDAGGEVVGASNPNRRAALGVVALQVIASGTAASLGAYIVASTPSTPITTTSGAAVGIATINDAGTILTFPNTITAFTIIYIPRSAVSMTAAQPALDGSP